MHFHQCHTQFYFIVPKTDPCLVERCKKTVLKMMPTLKALCEIVCKTSYREEYDGVRGHYGRAGSKGNINITAFVQFNWNFTAFAIR